MPDTDAMVDKYLKYKGNTISGLIYVTDKYVYDHFGGYIDVSKIINGEFDGCGRACFESAKLQQTGGKTIDLDPDKDGEQIISLPIYTFEGEYMVIEVYNHKW